ncbi:MAG: PQQ-binding-like beta-propeller repeat protein, partial [Halobacteria archaeon]|nr:PQQ-binding-like beta-propeller repeat protein [Halobacteria archaeon]
MSRYRVLVLLLTICTLGASIGPVSVAAQEAGTVKWSYKTDYWVTSSPTVVDGTVYVGSADSNVYALDASTGNKTWNFTAGDNVYDAPAVVDGTVYVGSSDSKVYALDASDGSRRWSYETGGDVISSPTAV